MKKIILSIIVSFVVAMGISYSFTYDKSGGRQYSNASEAFTAIVKKMR